MHTRWSETCQMTNQKLAIYISLAYDMLMRSLPPLSAIRAFEAAARHKNYTRAGEELGLTQAGVSYQIRSLEARVGTTLFVRNGRYMDLTPAGEALAPRIAQAFANMEGAFASLAENQDSVLSISCSQTIATKFIAPRLGTFQLAHPEIAVRMDVSDELADLEAGDCDIAIRFSAEAPTNLESHILFHAGVAAVACPEFLESRPELRENHPAVAQEHRISADYLWWRAWDDALCAQQGQSAERGGLRFDSQLLDAEAAMGGNGVALLMPGMFHAEINDGRLERLGDFVVWPESLFRLVYPEVRRHSPKVRAFRNWLLKEAQQHLAGASAKAIKVPD